MTETACGFADDDEELREEIRRLRRRIEMLERERKSDEVYPRPYPESPNPRRWTHTAFSSFLSHN